MEYRHRYSQPFSLEEAVQMDVGLITEEIARLQHSLQHLKRTQDELQEAMASDPDPEFTKAIQENEEVIGSQEERVSILKMALTQKGIIMGSHYDIANGHNVPRLAAAVSSNIQQNTSPATQTSPDDDGIHL